MSFPAGAPQALAPRTDTPPQDISTMPAIPPAAEINENGVVVRPMRLKVLYTFDDHAQSLCLARWPDVLQIQTITMDDGSTIGVVELKTCLQAVVQCSPELIARVGTDYTVYAYDFSEGDTPLVGQGMLSKAMAVPSPAPNASQGETGQLITGRVCKNILGMLTTGSKEILEVKLRLMPVYKVEPQHMDNTHRHSISSGNENTEWNAFMQQNPGMGQVTKRTPTPILNTHQRDGVSMEIFNQLLSPQIQSQPNADPFNQETSNNADSENGPGKKTSRPASRASVKRPRARKPKAAATGGSTSGYEEGTDGDDGPAPKKRRARVTKANQQNNNAFNTAPDSLRVAASTAGSLRMFRPIAMATGTTAGAGAHLQEVPRAPTPVPMMGNRAPSQVSLRRDSMASQYSLPPRQQMSPYLPDEVRNSIETANPSPDRTFSPDETPPNITSSPPVMRTRPVTPAGMRSSPPCASSPALPQMPRTDSGFMSGSMEDLFGEDEDANIDPNLPRYGPPKIARPVPARPGPQEDNFKMVMPGPAELLPTKMPIIEDPSAVEARARAAISRANSVMSEDGQVLPQLKKPRALARKRAPPKERKAEELPASQNPLVAPSPTDRMGSEPSYPMPPLQSLQLVGPRSMVRTASTGVLGRMPTIPASDPILPPYGLQRSNTWSETPRPENEDTMMQTGLSTSASAKNAAKKALIKLKLAEAVEKGLPPQFCSNCGCVETPTWRKAYMQEREGAPAYYDYSDEPGRVTCIKVKSRDPNGVPTSYELIKKSLSPDESVSEFTSILHCNPCGIWLSKYNTPRPESRWEQGPSQERNRTKKPRAPKGKKGAEPKSEAPIDAAYLYSEAIFPQSEAYYLNSEAMGPPESAPFSEIRNNQSAAPTHARRGSMANLPVKPMNAMNAGTASRLQRAIQSSPARWAGTRNSPIDVEEDDMGETRRLIFPSPRKEGSPKILGEIVANVLSTPTGIQFVKENVTHIFDKENNDHLFADDAVNQELVAFFEAELAKGSIAAPPRPTTPVRDSAPLNPFKTPTRPPPSHRPITRSVSRSTHKSPSNKSPSHNTLHPSNPNHTPSRTPRRSPRFQDNVLESPFTRSLNLMMRDAQNMTSPIRGGMGMDFGHLPDLPGQHGEMGNFSLEDFFSTDVPMPSSPPRGFGIMYDENALDGVNWNDFGGFAVTSGPRVGVEVQVEVESAVVVKEEVVEEDGDNGVEAAM